MAAVCAAPLAAVHSEGKGAAAASASVSVAAARSPQPDGEWSEGNRGA